MTTDNTSTQETISPETTNQNDTSTQETTDFKQLYEASEQRRKETQSFKDRQINERNEALRLAYSQDPSKIHSLEDAGMRNLVTKLVFPEYDSYEEAKSANIFNAPFTTDTDIKTESLAARVEVLKEYDPIFSDDSSVEKFYQIFDATNPRLSEKERFELSKEIMQARYAKINKVQDAADNMSRPIIPSAPVAATWNKPLTEEERRARAREILAANWNKK